MKTKTTATRKAKTTDKKETSAKQAARKLFNGWKANESSKELASADIALALFDICEAIFEKRWDDANDKIYRSHKKRLPSKKSQAYRLACLLSSGKFSRSDAHDIMSRAFHNGALERKSTPFQSISDLKAGVDKRWGSGFSFPDWSSSDKNGEIVFANGVICFGEEAKAEETKAA